MDLSSAGEAVVDEEMLHRSARCGGSPSAFDRYVASPAVRVLARRYCPPNDLGISPDQVHAEAIRRIWEHPSTAVVHDADGYLRSRLAYAYRTLRRQALAVARMETRLEPHHLDRRTTDDPADRVVQRMADEAWAAAAHRALTRRIECLSSDEASRRRALETLRVLVELAAQDGRPSESVPQRSSRLEEGEHDLLAAICIAERRLGQPERPVIRRPRVAPPQRIEPPSLGPGAAGPDDSATRKRRQRLLAVVRDETLELGLVVR